MSNTPKITRWLPTPDDTYTSFRTKSWFHIDCQNRDGHSEIDIDMVDFVKTRETIIFPDRIQRTILDEWFRAFVEMYNTTVEYVRELLKGVNKNEEILDFCMIRYYLSDKQNEIHARMMYPIPHGMLVEAIKYATNICKNKILRCNKRGEKIRIRKISQDKCTKMLIIPLRCIRDPMFCGRVFRTGEMMGLTSKSAGLTTRFIILHRNTTTDAYKIIVPGSIPMERYDKIVKTECGVDPGCRTFMTTFANDGAYSIGTQLTSLLGEHYTKIRDLEKLMRHDPNVAPFRTPELKRLYSTVSNMVTEMHHKTAKFLVMKYNKIYLGKFRPLEILAHKNNLSKQAQWIMKVLDHDAFRMRLIVTANKYGSEVYEVDEYMTTKTCSACGNVADGVQGSVYKCCKCEIVTYRDVNAAKNILRIGKG